MEILRINTVNVLDNKTIVATFTHKLINNINETNINIISDTVDVPDATPLKIVVSSNEVRITCTPLSEFAIYYLYFVSTNEKPFISLHNEARLIEDGVANKYVIQGPLPENNPVKEFLKSYYDGNVYDIDSSNGLIAKYLDGLSNVMSRALYDIGQVKNENYISHTIVDERHVRGGGPTDRLKEEGAYQLLRVGRTKAEANVEKSLVYDFFPFYPITLQGVNAQETLSISTTNQIKSFNKIDFILNLSNNPVTRLNSVRFIMSNSSQIYDYNIETFGYQILDSRYDKEYGFEYNSITDSQIKLSDKLLEDDDFDIESVTNIIVSYQYKNLGIIPDTNTVVLSTVKSQVREVLPPIINVFNLSHNNIVDEIGQKIKLGGLSFFNPNSNNINAPHPAFLYEIEYKLSSLPHLPGQYAVDYDTGTVYVYGANSTNDGTGDTPPLVSYNYKYFYTFDQDYVYDENFIDIVSLPTGVLRNNSGTVTFNYESVLRPNIDYKSSLHTEKLNERINNNLVSLNSLRAQNSPVTNVFRVYNETSGEVYSPSYWDKDKIYFTYNTPPKVLNSNLDRATFKNITNELLFVNTTLTNSNSIKVFKILLQNNSIISASEDGIGYFLNSSLFFSNTDVFANEKWFNPDNDYITSVNKISAPGEFVVDYINGVIYVGVTSSQTHDIGIANYKKNELVTSNDHIISVENIYYQLSPLSNIENSFDYISFNDSAVVVQNLHNMDEQKLSFNDSANYFIYNNYIGVFDGSQFHSGVTFKIKNVRYICELSDITNSTNPINFANYSTFVDNKVVVNPISKSIYSEVQYNLTDGYHILIDENIPYISANINYNFSVIRESSNTNLWDSSGTIQEGSPVKLILSGNNSPIVGEIVLISYTFTINNSSNIVIDYNRGDLYIDYTYLNDEIIISYEYGDNVIDFKESTTVSEGEEYYVSYRVGALRDSLIKNFGNLINIPELTNFDISFERERYRDAVFAGLSSFVQGPTVSAIKTIGKVISHIEPIISESIFNGWDLGTALLTSSEIKTSGLVNYLSGKFDHGVMLNNSEQTITFPYNSNIRLEEGTFESWITPNWNGLDNDAELKFTITKNNVNILSNKVFIGQSESHPEIINNCFSIKNIEIGTPNTNKDGVYIYYIEDDSTLFNKWCIEIIDGYSSTPSTYNIKINTDGKFYNFKSANNYNDVNIFSGNSYTTISITPTDTIINRKFYFISDKEKYLLDFGSGEVAKNRVSLFKDVNGYFVFKVNDRNGKQYQISYDVSGWSKYEKHHVAASWKLNTKNNADELHLFIDGFEVPNLHKYKQKHTPYLYEDFRTVSSEEIIGLSNKDILSSVDLETVSGNNVVSSSINFSAYNINIGDIIIIDEVWFDDGGYTIIDINGQELTLNESMPVTLSDAKFYINKTDYIVNSCISSSPNIAVYRVPLFLDGYVSGSANSNIITSSINFESNEVLPGFSINIDGYSEYNYPIVSVSGTQIIIDGQLSDTINNQYCRIYSSDEEEIPGVRAERPSYSISQDGYYNDIISLENNVYANDLLLIRTLGFNSESVKMRHYLWSNWEENIISTNLPPPISLDNVSIRKVILPKTNIDSSNSTLISGVFQSNNLAAEQTINAEDGRSLSVAISGTNIDFSSPVKVIVNGVSEIYTISETITFNENDGYEKFTNNLFKSINWVKVNAKPVNSSKPAVVVEIKERYDVTRSENSGLVPEIKYSYPIGFGTKLYSNDGYVVRDDTKTFSEKHVGNYLLIHAPAYNSDGYTAINVPGFYVISGISSDRKSLEIESTSASSSKPLDLFVDGYYTVLNVTDYRSGLQNGRFTFEAFGMPRVSYPLPRGNYDFEYKTYAKIKLDPEIGLAYLGSNLFGNNQIDGIIDQVKIYSTMLTDTRIGETIPPNQRSVTKDFNSLTELTADENTLMLINFNNTIENESDQYIYENKLKGIFHSEEVVNSSFGHSVCLLDKPIVLSNDGILNVNDQATIEFWTNPKYDTGNDPNERYYFDAFGAVIENVVSENNSTINVSGSIENVISVKLTHNESSPNYFDGGAVEIDSDRTIRENLISVGNAIVITNKNILQVTSVKIEGDVTNVDYFNFGSVDQDKRTIYLGTALPQNNMNVIVTYQPAENQNDKINKQVIRLNRKLPRHNTPVTVTYLPRKMRGDRISLFKDMFGYVNFRIISNGETNIVRAPTKWVNGTWHRVKASYIVNSKNNTDEMRLWVDGYEYSNTLFNNNIHFNKFPHIYGGASVGDGYFISNKITFKDPINTLFIGSAYDKTNPVYSLIDNLRISNVSRPIYSPYNESIDVNWSSNISAAIPVTEDLYTTYLLNLSSNRVKNDYFALIKNRESGLFNFLVKIIDSYGIIDSSEKSKEVLEKLINILKPANTRAFIQYIS